MDLEDLYQEVTAAIGRTEAIEVTDPGYKAAQRRVAELEGRIAALLPPDDVEGAIARRGAVRAAIAAGDREWAQRLAAEFIAEPAIPPELRDQLWGLLRGTRTTVLSFAEFTEPLERAVSESSRACRLKGQCPALQYMSDGFTRYLQGLRKKHDWLILTATPPHAMNGATRRAPTPPGPGTPRPGGRVGFVSLAECEAAFGRILDRSDRRCRYEGDCAALHSTRSRVSQLLDGMQRDNPLLLVRSHGDSWTGDVRAARLRAVADNVAGRRSSPHRPAVPPAALTRG